jgi:hypothetical protein
MSVKRTLLEDLNDLHASYVEAINMAVGADDYARAHQLAADYDTEAIQLMAEREGKTHLLPLRRRSAPETPLRRLARRLTTNRAA